MVLLISCRLAMHPHVKTLGAIFVQQSHQRTLLLSTQGDLLGAVDWKLGTRRKGGRAGIVNEVKVAQSRPTLPPYGLYSPWNFPWPEYWSG